MAQTIKLKRSATQGAIPTTSSLALGEVAINTYDGKMYIKKNDGSDSIVELGTGGDAPAGGVWTEYLYTATAGQTAFTGSDDNSNTLSFLTGYIQVFFNGILLDPAVDYTTSGNTVTLTVGASLSDVIQIAAFSKVLGTGDIIIDSFTGDNTTTAFTMSADPGVEGNTQIFVDGVYQNKTGYSISGTALTFSEAPATSAAIEVAIGSREISYADTTAITLSGDVSAVNGTFTGGLTVSGAIATTSTVDGRDVATDGTKLDGIEASADVTDTANVTSSGALMDSEVTNLAQVKAFASSDYATAAQGTTADSALQTGDKVAVGIESVVTATSLTATVNTHVYVSAAGQTITLPTGPTIGQRVMVTVGNFVNTIIGRNSSNIMSSGTDMTLDTAYLSIQFIYIDSTRGWVIS
jgi:hypothetical protein